MPWEFDSFRAKTYCGTRGWINYLLIFAENRVVAAKTGKSSEFDSAASGGAYFGVIGAIFGARSKHRHCEKLEATSLKLKELTMEEILSLERENFQIAYADINTATINKEASVHGIGTLKIEGNVDPVLAKLGLATKKGSFQKRTRRDIDFHIELARALSNVSLPLLGSVCPSHVTAQPLNTGVSQFVL